MDIHDTVLVSDNPMLLRYPEFLDTTLPNGLRVLIAEHHEQPAVFFRMLVKVGDRDEPTGKEGLADIAAELLNQGAGPRSAEEIAQAIESVGGRLWAESDDEYTTVVCDVLAGDLPLGLGLFADVILQPAFPERDLARIKKQAVTEVKQEHEDPTTLAQRHVMNLLVGAGSRLGRERTGKSIASVTADDIRSLHRAHFLPDNSVLLVMGDFDRNDMLARLTDRFGAWSKSSAPERPPLVARALAGVEFRFVDKPDLTQGTIALAHWGITRTNPDEPAYRLMSYILVEGGFASRLYSVVRAKEGKTYHVGALRSYHPDFGTYGVWTFTRNDEVVKTYQSIHTELRKFIAEGVTDDELQKAMAYYHGNIPLRLETPDAVARRILDGAYYGLTIDDQRREVVRLNAVTREDVNRVARQYLSADNFVLVIVGNGKETRAQLGAIGRFTEVSFHKPVQDA
jgi:zinc protease